MVLFWVRVILATIDERRVILHEINKILMGKYRFEKFAVVPALAQMYVTYYCTEYKRD